MPRIRLIVSKFHLRTGWFFCCLGAVAFDLRVYECVRESLGALVSEENRAVGV